ncbi:MAG: hypothetical protein WC890_04390 [Candidatus Margulisiibacteriota bacterium]
MNKTCFFTALLYFVVSLFMAQSVLAKDNLIENQYCNFSTSPNMIFVQILNRDHPTQSADIICENTDFYNVLRSDPIFAPIIKSSADYAKYMRDGQGIIFGLSDKAYKRVASWQKAPLTNEMQKDLREGPSFIINKYLAKQVSSTNEKTGEKSHSWFIRSKYNDSPSVMRLMLQSGFSIRRSCLAGIYYIEGIDEYLLRNKKSTK